MRRGTSHHRDEGIYADMRSVLVLVLAILQALWCVGAVPVSACLCLLQLHASLVTAPVQNI